MIRVIEGEIPIEETIKSLRDPKSGAILSYLGTVCEFAEGRASQGLAFKVEEAVMQEALEGVRTEALQKFDLTEVSIVHRTGSFAVGDSILLIAIGSVHRGPALRACEYIIDRIKDLHESWKREKLGE